jgi:hypothetical protein
VDPCDLPAAWDHLRLVLAGSMGPASFSSCQTGKTSHTGSG